jgi:hypothetical protein
MVAAARLRFWVRALGPVLGIAVSSEGQPQIGDPYRETFCLILKSSRSMS